MSDFLHTTVTERASFRTCRRQWYLDTVELLEPAGSVAWALIFGTVVHEALDAYYRSGQHLDACLDAFDAAWTNEDNRLAREYGGLYTQGIEEEWFDYQQKGRQMLTYYDIHDKESKFFSKVVDVGLGFDAWREHTSVEERQFVNILNFSGDPTGDLLSGRIDLVVERPDGLWIVDHKTAASAPSWRALEVDDQLTGYCYIYYRMTGKIPRGALYNVLLKDPPKPPRVLVKGGLSKDKDQRTTYDLYRDAIEEHGLNLADYEEFLNFLADKGWSTFFPRDGMQRNAQEMDSFERRLAAEIQDMHRAMQVPEHRYPNPQQTVCRMCQFVSLCQAMEDGSDVESVRESMYQVKEPRHKVPEELKGVVSTKIKSAGRHETRTRRGGQRGGGRRG